MEKSQEEFEKLIGQELDRSISRNSRVKLDDQMKGLVLTIF